MNHYRIKPDELVERLAEVRLDASAEILVDPESGDLLLRTAEPLNGLKKTNRQTFDDLQRRLVENPDFDARLVTSDLQAAGEWRVEPHSERRAVLAPVAGPSGAPALRIALDARSDRALHVGRSVHVPAAPTLRMFVRTFLPPNALLSIGAVLTTETEHPWLDVDPVEVATGDWSEVNLDLSQLHPSRLARSNRLVLVLVTDADEGTVLVDRLSFTSDSVVVR
jgi:hypothetical protein